MHDLRADGARVSFDADAAALDDVLRHLTAVVPLGFVSAFNATAPTAAARQDYVDTSVHNTAFIIAYGPLHGSGLGQLVTWRAGFIPVIVGLVALLLMIRHTRGEEEAGRLELVGATAVGRHAGLAAALLSVLIGSVLVSTSSALALAAAGGAFVFGLGLLLTGCAFAAVGAICAQLTAGAGGAGHRDRRAGRGLPGTRLRLGEPAVGRLARLAGLVVTGRLGGRLRPYAGDRWWAAVPCPLATLVRRLRWAWSHFLFALLGPTLGLAVFGAVLGLAHGINTGDVAGQVPALLGAALVRLPAVWLFAGVAFALFGLLPRLSVWAFAVMALSLFLGWLGAEFQLGGWVTGLSAFSHIPKLPAEPLNVLPLAVLTAMAAALIAAGSAGIRGRDLPIG